MKQSNSLHERKSYRDLNNRLKAFLRNKTKQVQKMIISF